MSVSAGFKHCANQQSRSESLGTLMKCIQYWRICTPIALVECMFPDRSTTPWLRTPGLIVIAGLYVLGVVATFAVTWAEYRYVASAGRLIGAAIIAVILIIAGMLLTRLRRSSRAGIQGSRLRRAHGSSASSQQSRPASW